MLTCYLFFQFNLYTVVIQESKGLFHSVDIINLKNKNQFSLLFQVLVAIACVISNDNACTWILTLCNLCSNVSCLLKKKVVAHCLGRNQQDRGKQCNRNLFATN